MIASSQSIGGRRSEVGKRVLVDASSRVERPRRQFVLVDPNAIADLELAFRTGKGEPNPTALLRTALQRGRHAYAVVEAGDLSAPG
jgi:hypothetical protein